MEALWRDRADTSGINWEVFETPDPVVFTMTCNFVRNVLGSSLKPLNA
jgi:hypothetical protein